MLNEHLYRWPSKTRSIGAYESVAACFLVTKHVSVSQIYFLSYEAEVFKNQWPNQTLWGNLSSFTKWGWIMSKYFTLTSWFLPPFKTEIFNTFEHILIPLLIFFFLNKILRLTLHFSSGWSKFWNFSYHSSLKLFLSTSSIHSFCWI